ncbi:hypothetical protein GQ42DRAFT_160912 [Ramicandelaber brevisporus]|nr:hypothetical protein GQ42DRAFT_160912 [Ramicandelaber brevisporus]
MSHQPPPPPPPQPAGGASSSSQYSSYEYMYGSSAAPSYGGPSSSDAASSAPYYGPSTVPSYGSSAANAANATATATATSTGASAGTGGAGVSSMYAGYYGNDYSTVPSYSSSTTIATSASTSASAYAIGSGSNAYSTMTATASGSGTGGEGEGGVASGSGSARTDTGAYGYDYGYSSNSYSASNSAGGYQPTANSGGISYGAPYDSNAYSANRNNSYESSAPYGVGIDSRYDAVSPSRGGPVKQPSDRKDNDPGRARAFIKDRPVDHQTLRISQLPKQTTTDDIRQAFSAYGTLEDVLEKSGHRFFVKFTNEPDASAAKRAFDGEYFMGMRIAVEYARVMPEQNDPEGNRCYICGRLGHWAKTCPDNYKYQNGERSSRKFDFMDKRGIGRVGEGRDERDRDYRDNRDGRDYRRGGVGGMGGMGGGGGPRRGDDGSRPKLRMPKSCYRCGSQTHLSRNCDKPFVESDRRGGPGGDIRCYVCSEYGHKADNCKVERDYLEAIGNPQSKESPSSHGPRRGSYDRYGSGGSGGGGGGSRARNRSRSRSPDRNRRGPSAADRYIPSYVSGATAATPSYRPSEPSTAASSQSYPYYSSTASAEASEPYSSYPYPYSAVKSEATEPYSAAKYEVPEQQVSASVVKPEPVPAPAPQPDEAATAATLPMYSPWD